MEHIDTVISQAGDAAHARQVVEQIHELHSLAEKRSQLFIMIYLNKFEIKICHKMPIFVTTSVPYRDE